jgi:hypothetical protein
MTAHEVRVDTVVNDGGIWKGTHLDLPTGYGGAARARITSMAAAWQVADDGSPGFPWP